MNVDHESSANTNQRYIRLVQFENSSVRSGSWNPSKRSYVQPGFERPTTEMMTPSPNDHRLTSTSPLPSSGIRIFIARSNLRSETHAPPPTNTLPKSSWNFVWFVPNHTTLKSQLAPCDQVRKWDIRASLPPTLQEVAPRRSTGVPKQRL